MANEEQEMNRNRIETEILLSTFPKEIWLEIFEKVKHVEALRSLYSSAKIFKGSLSDQYTRLFFPEVFHILVANKYLSKMHMKGIRSCRLACHIWKDSVDETLQIHGFYNEFSRITNVMRYVPIPHVHRRCLITEFYGGPSYNAKLTISNFTGNYINSQIIPALRTSNFPNKSPFPSRFLNYEGDRVKRDMEARRTAACDMLAISGGYILYADIKDNTQSIVEWYNTVQSIVRLLPNLQTLQLLCPGLYEDRVDSELECLQSTVEQLPFPHLESLQRLSMQKMPSVVINAILEQNRHVKMVEVLDLDSRNVLLEIRGPIYPSWINFSLKDSRELAQLSPNWKLEGLKLNIELNKMANTSPFVLESVFQKVKMYQETLTELHLILPTGYESELDVDTKASSSNLELSKVKRLVFRGQPTCFLSFILGMPALEFLTIENTWAKGAVLDMDSENMKNIPSSNVWKLFPRLKKIKVMFDRMYGYTTFVRQEGE